jgi:preprotein translocase subunit YajC
VTTTDTSIDIEIAPGVVTSWLRAAVREKVADSTVGLSADEAEDVYDDEDTVGDDEATVDAPEDAVPDKTAQVAPSLEESSKKAR